MADNFGLKIEIEGKRNLKTPFGRSIKASRFWAAK